MTPRADRRLGRLLMAAVTGLFFLIGAPALNPRSALVSWDLQGHILRAEFFARDVLGAGALTGWFPFWHGGFPLPDVYPPLATWILAAFAWLGISQVGGRLLMVAIWTASVPCSYYALRSFGLRRTSAAAGACVTSALASPRTFGAYALFQLGLIPNGLGFVLAIASLGKIRRALAAEAVTAGDLAGAGLLAGLTILAHPFCAYWLVVASLALIAGETLIRPHPGISIGRAAVIGAIAAAIGASYWVPLVAGRSNLLKTDPFAVAGVVGTWQELASMKYAGGWALSALGFLGLAALSQPRRKSELVFFSIAGAATFALTLGFGNRFLPLGETLATSQRARFEGFYAWLILALSAFAFDAAIEKAGERGVRAAAAVVAAVAAAVALRGASQHRLHVGFAGSAGIEDIRHIGGEISSRLVPGDFVLTEIDNDSVRNFGSPHALNQRLPRANRYIWDQGGSFPEGTRGAERMSELARSMAETLPSAGADLASRGVRFVATTGPQARQVADGLPWLERIWPKPPESALAGAALFEIRGFQRRMGLPPELVRALSSVSYEPKTGYRLSFSPATPAPYPVDLAISFHPWLTGDADGKPLSLNSTRDGRVILSGGPAVWSTLTIAYRPPAFLSVIRLLSLLALVAFAAISLAPRRGGPSGELFRRESA
ncbi:MAG: hypothetical protein JO102_03435 [Elusimicrobia bacterium]|nr:hypothetical protein [Elusimicrobiota bacterium]